MSPSPRSTRTAQAEHTELCERARRGDVDGWTTLIELHTPTVLQRLRRTQLSEAQLEDVVQATWLRLIEKSRRGELMELILPGLAIREAWFRASDLRAARQHLPMLHEEAESPDLVAPDAEDALLVVERAHALRVVVEDLPPRMREIVVRRYWDEQSAKDIARGLGIREDTVWEALGSAMQRLRRAMGVS